MNYGAAAWSASKLPGRRGPSNPYGQNGGPAGSGGAGQSRVDGSDLSVGSGGGADGGGGGNNANAHVSEKLLRGQALGFLLMRAQELLRAANRPLATYDLQLAFVRGGAERSEYNLSYYSALFSDGNFTNVLRSNSRIHFDLQTRKWSYVSPYAAIVSMDSLKTFVEGKKTGLEITQEVLDHLPQMGEWIQRLLEQKKLRALRTGKAMRCKNFAPDSGFTCDLYEPRTFKCDTCANLKNVTLYNRHPPLATEAKEPCELDEDLRELWANVKLPALEAMLEDARTREKAKQLERYVRTYYFV